MDEGNLFASGNERPTVERLGKKYQWLALSELLCHLTSNLALEDGYHEDRTHRGYDIPPDLGLVRDIDPTVLAYAPAATTSAAEAWMFGSKIVLDEVSEQDLSAWPVRTQPAGQLDQQVVRTAPDGRRWFTLYDHAHVTDSYLDRAGDYGMRQQEVRRIFTVLVENARLDAFVANIARREALSVSDWEVPQLTDGPYLGGGRMAGHLAAGTVERARRHPGAEVHPPGVPPVRLPMGVPPGRRPAGGRQRVRPCRLAHTDARVDAISGPHRLGPGLQGAVSPSSTRLATKAMPCCSMKTR